MQNANLYKVRGTLPFNLGSLARIDRRVRGPSFAMKDTFSNLDDVLGDDWLHVVRTGEEALHVGPE
jgi:hypothetical protein